jgi:bifunctional UDP-N-acetylglucosamine pyrophosphorylase/glucosamine-1-phosphate N-acetyltransferase
MIPNTAVAILAAGQGTRMKSRMAKVLHRAGGRTLIEHAIAASIAVAPAERVFAIVGHQAEAVGEVARAAGAGIIHQKEQLGTGHAVMCGRDQLETLGGLLLVVNGDCPMIRPESLVRLAELCLSSGAGAAMITTDLDDPTGYGRIVRAGDGSVQAIVEHKAATPEQRRLREINAGFYCFDAALFWKHVGELNTNNPAGEYYLTDMIAILLAAGHRVEALKIADSAELRGINNRVELAEADGIIRMRTAREMMLEGVTIEKPETVTIDIGVRAGADTVIESGARITGATVIGENCRIGTGAILHNATLGDGVEIHPYTLVSDSHLASGSHAGPFARIRMNTQIAAGAHIGNFVELKNTQFGPGSKSMHLAYLGDSEIGSKVNVGAGTITCNYDGKRKHRTRISDGVFVGSNSTLVAPLQIEDGAYIAAGSVITQPVPKKSLALGRARQVVKENWKPKE